MDIDNAPPYEAPAIWYVLVCRECDPELSAPMPFVSPEERGRWAGAHTRGTGHNRWYVVDEVNR